MYPPHSIQRVQFDFMGDHSLGRGNYDLMGARSLASGKKLFEANSLFSDLAQFDFMGALGAHSLGVERNFLRLKVYFRIWRSLTSWGLTALGEERNCLRLEKFIFGSGAV